MLNSVFHNNFPFVAKYFEEKLSKYFEDKTSFPQSIILEGLDTWGELFLALEIARILNCESEKEEFCFCRNCNWTKNMEHPSIILLSPIDFKEVDGDKSKTVISENQCSEVAKMLEETSDYHRIFIFLDAKAEELSEIERAKLEKYTSLNYRIKEDWHPEPLSHKVFPDTGANALLKSVEEPPKRTTFFFLTNNKENIISTIVSRSQVFKMPEKVDKSASSYVDSLFKNYPNFDLIEALDISAKLQNHIRENSILSINLITMLENYFSELLKANANNKNFIKIFKEDTKKIYKAEKMIKASMQTKNVLDWLLIELAHK